MGIELTRQQRQGLEASGFLVELLPEWQPKMTYYTPTGKALPNLPADAYSLQHYLRRGFTLSPPQPKPVKKRGNNHKEKTI